MKIISYWQDFNEIYKDDGLVFITGYYNHKNQNERGVKALGIHWGNYPQSRGVLAPCVIPEQTQNAILSGLLYQSALNGDSDNVTQITEAINFFKT